ncbi:hypothetical protein PO909_028623 [Leuciscus waleckii]
MHITSRTRGFLACMHCEPQRSVGLHRAGLPRYLNIWLMSSETILPPEGPEGPNKQLHEETNQLLSKRGTEPLTILFIPSIIIALSKNGKVGQNKCNSCSDESSDATETSRTPIPGDHTSDEQGHMTGENHTHDGLVRMISRDVLPSCPACLQVHRTSARSFRQASDHWGVTGEPPTDSIQTVLPATAKIDMAISL